MSIWSTLCSFGYIGPGPAGTEPKLDDMPYLDFVVPATGQYVWETTTPAELATVPRGGFVDVATSWDELPLVRLSVEGAAYEAEVWLHVDQVTRLHAKLGEWLASHQRKEQDT